MSVVSGKVQPLIAMGPEDRLSESRFVVNESKLGGKGGDSQIVLLNCTAPCDRVCSSFLGNQCVMHGDVMGSNSIVA